MFDLAWTSSFYVLGHFPLFQDTFIPFIQAPLTPVHDFATGPGGTAAFQVWYPHRASGTGHQTGKIICVQHDLRNVQRLVCVYDPGIQAAAVTRCPSTRNGNDCCPWPNHNPNSENGGPPSESNMKKITMREGLNSWHNMRDVVLLILYFVADCILAFVVFKQLSAV